MARLANPTLLCATLLAAPAAACLGQAAPAAPPPPAQTYTPAGTPAPETTSRRPRAISSEAAAALAAATPKYTPPPPKPAPKPEAELVDARDIDKPKNTIVRLPKYIVQEKKPPVFRERDIHTEKGLTEIAMRRYISDFDRALNRWTIPFIGISKEARALAMYAEDERLRNMSDLNDAGVNATKTNPAAGTYILKESQKTFLRSSDFGWNGGGPK